jgi:hypothetical protein
MRKSDPDDPTQPGLSSSSSSDAGESVPTQGEVIVVEHPRLGPSGASALRAQFDCNLTAIWFKFDVGGQETEAPEGPRLQ